MVMLMENKHPLQRPLKMNERNEQITQPFHACRLQDRHFSCKMPLHNNVISNPALLQDTNTGAAKSQAINVSTEIIRPAVHVKGNILL